MRLVRVKADAEAKIVVSHTGHEPVAKRSHAVRGDVPPPAAAQNGWFGVKGSTRVDLVVGSEFPVLIGTPFPDVAVNVEQPSRVRREQTDRVCLPTAVSREPADFFEGSIAIAVPKLRGRTGPARILTLRFRGQANRSAREAGHLLAKRIAIVPRDGIHGPAFPFELAAIVTEDCLPLVLRDRGDAEVKTLRERDAVRGIVGLVVPAHLKRSRRNPTERDRHAVAEIQFKPIPGSPSKADQPVVSD